MTTIGDIDIDQALLDETRAVMQELEAVKPVFVALAARGFDCLGRYEQIFSSPENDGRGDKWEDAVKELAGANALTDLLFALFSEDFDDRLVDNPIYSAARDAKLKRWQEEQTKA